MSLFYRFAYWAGVTPWEEMAELAIGRQVHSLLDREEAERRRPFGSALDLGCGSGLWTVHLATRGWKVTGIDIVPKAVRAARDRVREAGVEARLVRGDMTALRESGVGSEFGFLLDLGAIHGLGDRQRLAVGREITAVAAAEATMLLMAWVPARRGPLPRGMDRDGLREAFPDWDLVAEDAADVSGAPGLVQRARPWFYRLRRR